MFEKYVLDFQENIFEQASSCMFEDIVNGRKGAILVSSNEDNIIPLVRTTTQYTKPAQYFLPIHLDIINKIKNATNNHSEITLDHNSIILFSTETNKNYLHKIILDKISSTSHNINNRWLGITFRLAKTFVKFIDETAYFYPQMLVLRLADNSERKQFYKERGNENINFTHDYHYPSFDFTISSSDLMKVV